MQEIFKDIPGYEGIYQVSNLGNVKSLSRLKTNNKSFYLTKEKILKQSLRGRNKKYYFVKFYDRKTFSTHQLVAMAFLNHIPNNHKLVVDHINNNSKDNRVDNLQLITSRENRVKDIANKSLKSIGVYLCKNTGKYRSRIMINGKTKCLGRFDTELEASIKYQNKLKEI